MIVKLSTLVVSSQELTAFSQIKGLPVRRVFALAKLVNQVQKELDAYNQAVNSLGAHYGTPAPQPGAFSVPPEHYDAVNVAMRELGDTEVTLDIEPLTLDELDMGADSINLSPAMLAKLDWLVEL